MYVQECGSVRVRVWQCVCKIVIVSVRGYDGKCESMIVSVREFDSMCESLKQKST